MPASRRALAGSGQPPRRDRHPRQTPGTCMALRDGRMAISSLATALMLAVSACVSEDPFLTQAQLEAEIRPLHLVGKRAPDAIASLGQIGFSCHDGGKYCVREAHSLPCVQDQTLLLKSDASGRIAEVLVPTYDNGRLPNACL